MSGFLKVAWLVLRKDLRVESRSREMLFTTVFFAVSCVLVFSVAFVRGGQAVEGSAEGILWVVIAFSGTLALGRTFERERYHDGLTRPVARPGRSTGTLCRQVARAVVVAGGRSRRWSWRWWRSCSGRRCSSMSGGCWRCSRSGRSGSPASAPLFSAMLVRTGNRAVLLPVLLFPVHDSGAHDGGRGHRPRCCSRSPIWRWHGWGSGYWFFFDAVFLTLALWTFEPLMAE